MGLYTLSEASIKLKEHNITADYRKLIREAIAGKLILSIGLHGYFYSPTIKARCSNIVSKYTGKLLDIDRQENSYSDEITVAFETELIREVLNSSKFLKLSSDEKISYLYNSESMNYLYKRYSEPSLTGYYIVYPSQLLSPVNGSFEIKAVSDGRDMYFLNKTITHDELFICENHLQRYIEVLSDSPTIAVRTSRLYAEIEGAIPNWLSLNFSLLCKSLEQLKNKNGSCIKNVDYAKKIVEWLDYKNGKQSTDFGSIKRKISRANNDTKDKKDSIKN